MVRARRGRRRPSPLRVVVEAVEVDAPVGIAINKQGDIVVGQMGEVNKPQDSLLSFYSAKTKKLLSNFETKLYDITGVAYSPSGKLYVTDFAWMKPEEGGLYRIDQSGNDIKTVKIARRRVRMAAEKIPVKRPDCSVPQRAGR